MSCRVCRGALDTATERLSITSYTPEGLPAGTIDLCSPLCLAKAMRRYTVTDPERQSLREQVRDRVRRFRARRAAVALVTPVTLLPQ